MQIEPESVELYKTLGFWGILALNLAIAIATNFKGIGAWIGRRMNRVIEGKEEDKDRFLNREDQIWRDGLAGREQAIKILERVLTAKETEIGRERDERRSANVAVTVAQADALRVAEEWKGAYDKLADMMLQSLQTNTDAIHQFTQRSDLFRAVSERQIQVLGKLEATIDMLCKNGRGKPSA